MRFSAFARNGTELLSQIYYSIGGGFIVTEEDYGIEQPGITVPYPFTSAEGLLQLCRMHQLTIAELMLANEQALDPTRDVRAGLLEIAEVMQKCIEKVFLS